MISNPGNDNWMSQIAISNSNLKSQIAISSSDKMGLHKRPFAFTEHGVTMLASVLKSEIAVKASIQIVKAFVSMRHFVQSNSQIFDAYAKFESFIQSAQKESILIDNKVLYHIGASLKDLGKKCFAFEILDSSLIPDILKNI